MKRTSKSPARTKPSKKSREKPKTEKPPGKKFPPFTPPDTKIDPENLFIHEGKDGSKLIFVRPDFAGVACIYHPRVMKEAMAGLIFRFIETMRSGKEPDLSMFTAGAGAKIGRAQIRYEDEALQEAVAKYAQVAADYFTEHLVRVLADLPELLILQVLNATLSVMKAEGFLTFKEGSGVTEVWNSFTEALAKKIKRDWKSPKQGLPGIWNEKKRAEALEIYNSVREPLTRAYPHRLTVEGEEEWLRLIMELGGYDREEAQFKKASSPGGLALGIVGKRLGVTDEYTGKGESYLYYQLSIARSEKRAREEKLKIPRTSININDLFPMM